MLYQVFLELGRVLNTGFGVAPVLFGSVGLSRLLSTPIATGDIDLLVPQSILEGQWPRVVDELARMGFVLFDVDEHEFARADGVHVMFAAEEDLSAFAGVDAAGLPELEDTGVRFRSLDLRQYRDVYVASSKDGYRREKRGDADLVKVAIIDSALSAGA